MPRETISADSSPESVESWDSKQHLTFVLTLEEAFQLSPEETERVRMIGKAVKLLEEKLQGAGG